MPVSAIIDEAQINEIVPAFYARVRTDPLIGPVFDNAIDDWSVHLEKLVAFWSSVMLTTGRYKGNPMIAHIKHVAVLTPKMFDRWLALWKEVTDDRLPGDIAAALQHKAGRIAESLKLALWFRLAKSPAPSLPQPQSTGAGR